MPGSFAWFETRREIGALFVRLFMGTFLIYMSQDNVFSAQRMEEFAHFLRRFGFPLPALGAHVSAYAQFLCGILILVGAFTRPAAAVMIANFVVAIVMVHTRLPFREALDPSAMLAGALFRLFHGAGVPSVDAVVARRRGVGTPPSTLASYRR